MSTGPERGSDFTQKRKERGTEKGPSGRKDEEVAGTVGWAALLGWSPPPAAVSLASYPVLAL